MYRPQFLHDGQPVILRQEHSLRIAKASIYQYLIEHPTDDPVFGQQGMTELNLLLATRRVIDSTPADNTFNKAHKGIMISARDFSDYTTHKEMHHETT